MRESRDLGTVWCVDPDTGSRHAFYLTVSGRDPSSRPAVPAASPPGPEPVERDVAGSLP